MQTSSSISRNSSCVPLLPITQRAVAIAIVVALHIVVIGFVTAVAAYFNMGPPQAAGFSEAFFFTVLAVIMAYCSLTALWWSTAPWHSHIKTCCAAVAITLVWASLLCVLQFPRSNPEVAAAWATSFVFQAVLTAAIVAVVERCLLKDRTRLAIRFSISYLLVWTTVVAAILGAGRWIFIRFGWTVENFGAADFFSVLQAVAVANSVLAVVVWYFARMWQSVAVRVASSICAILLTAAVATGTMHLLFGDGFGASLLEYGWLVTAQGMFLAATLLPLEKVFERQRSRDSEMRFVPANRTRP